MANWFAGEPKEQLAGKTAVVMGGGSGIGKATAQALCAAGANVMICGVPEQICLDTAEELKAEGRATLTQCSPRPLKNSVASTW